MSRRTSFRYRSSAAERGERQRRQAQALLAGLNASLGAAESALADPRLRLHVADDIVHLRQRQAALSASAQAGNLELFADIRAATSQARNLPGRARSIELRVQEQERKRREELARMKRDAESEMEQLRLALVMSISDPVELDFVLPAMATLRPESPANPAEVAAARGRLTEAFAKIRSDAALKAKAWRNAQAVGTREGEAALIDEQKKRLAALHISTADGAADPATALSALERRVATGEINGGDLIAEVSVIAQALDGQEENEEVRRAVVAALMELLEGVGFVVEPPQRYIEAGDIVRIVARKPSGNAAEFAVGIDGLMTCTFDQYEGRECEMDMNEVMPKLTEIYGIELADERVLWENPDRISRSARPVDGSTGGHQHG